MREDTTCLEVVEETASLVGALRGLATHLHPSLPSIVDQDRVGEWLVVREETGPGRPVVGTEPWSAARAAAAGAGLCDGLESLRRQTLGRLPVSVTPEDLWITRAGVLRTRKLGLARWGEDPEPAAVMQGVVEAVRMLTRPDEHDRLAWVEARCSSGDPARCYESVGELGEALRRLAGGGNIDGLRLPPAPTPNRPAGNSPRRRPWPGALAAALAAALLLTVLGAWIVPADVPRPQEALAAAHGNRVTLVSLATGARLASWELPETAGDLVATPDGQRLFAAQREAGGLLMLEPFTTREPVFVRLAAGPQDVVMDEHGDRMYVTHPSGGLVTVVAVTKRGASCSAVLAVPAGTMDVASRHGILYCSDSRTVTSFGVSPMRRLAQVSIPGAGPLETSLGGRFLYVVDRLRPRVHVLDAGTLEGVGTVPLVRVAERLTRVGTEIWALEPGLLQPVSVRAPWIALPAGISDVAPGRNLVWFLNVSGVAADPDRGRCSAWLRLPAGTSRIAFVPFPRRR